MLGIVAVVAEIEKWERIYAELEHTVERPQRRPPATNYVTSSITWPIDSPYAISYWWSIGTEPLSPTVFEIFGPNTMLTNEHTNKHDESQYLLTSAQGSTRNILYEPLEHSPVCFDATFQSRMPFRHENVRMHALPNSVTPVRPVANGADFSSKQARWNFYGIGSGSSALATVIEPNY